MQQLLTVRHCRNPRPVYLSARIHQPGGRRDETGSRDQWNSVDEGYNLRDLRTSQRCGCVLIAVAVRLVSFKPTKGISRGRLLREAQSTSPRLFSQSCVDRISGLRNRLTILKLGLCITLTGLCRSLGLRTGMQGISIY
jgi:hypothetical protein